MVIEADLPVEERIGRLLDHLGLLEVHVAACRPEDWEGLVSRHPDRVASLTLVCPHTMDTAPLRPVASRLIVIMGDQGPSAPRIRQSLASIPDATLITLRDYVAQGWSDVIADRLDEIDTAMGEHLRRIDRQRHSRALAIPEGEGHVAGLSYRIRGTGPPLGRSRTAALTSRWHALFSKRETLIGCWPSWCG